MRKENLILAAIILGTLTYRGIIVFNSSLTFFSDDAVYAILARSCLENGCKYLFHPFWPPLYPFFSYLSYLFFHNWEVALRAVSVLFGTLTLIPLFILARKTLNLKLAILFTITVSFIIPLLNLSLLPLSDTLSGFFIISSMVAIFFAGTLGKSRLFYLGGFLTGLIYLTRSEGTMFFFLYLTFFFLFFTYRVIIKKEPFKIFFTLLMFITIFFLTTSPYIIATKGQLGYWSLSQKFSAQIQQGHAFALKNNTTWAQEIWSAKSPNYQSSYFHGGNEYVLDNFYKLSKSFNEKLHNWQNIFLSLFSNWSVLIIFIGIFSILKSKLLISQIFLIFILSSTTLVTIFSTSVYDIRYLAWSIPFYLYFFYLGINYIAKIYPKFSIPLFIPAIIILFQVSSSYPLNPLDYVRDFTALHEQTYVKEVGVWIKQNTSHSNPKIMTRHEGIEFYSGGETIYLPQVSKEKLLEYAKKEHIDYFVAITQELANDVDLHDFTNPNLNQIGWEKVYSISTSSETAVIYKLKIN